jgi:succinyl-diaminopimelate desuccinylase
MAAIDPVELSKELLRHETLTPVAKQDGFAPLVAALNTLPFEHTFYNFSEMGHDETCNLFATTGGQGDSKNLCFAGHLDVVPPGPLSAWKYPPFEPYEKDGMLVGRGTSDMKCAIACFMAAVARYYEAHPAPLKKGSISLLLTGDEEGRAINGTEKLLSLLNSKKYQFNGCIVGEPTSNDKVADMVKIGRRGSITFYVTLHGTQGHVAYPHLAKNPVSALCGLINIVQGYQFDLGTEFFDPTHLEVVHIQAGDGVTTNVIPGTASVTVNIRFNTLYNPLKLQEWLESQCLTISKEYDVTYSLQYRLSANTFGGEQSPLGILLGDAVQSVTGSLPNFGTTGGTSDARFISQYMPVVELGLLNATAHKANEQVAVKDIYTLTDIYYVFLEKWFAN